MKKNIHQGHRSRVRDRVRKEGLENFQEYQVLEYALSFVIPYKDTNPIAHELIDVFGSISGVLEADIDDLCKVKGISDVSAHFLTSIIKIYHFYEKSKVNKIGSIKSPMEAYEYVKKLFVGKTNEALYLISLSPNNKIVKTEKLIEGTVGQAKVAIRQITDMISRNKVNDVIVAHNHPNGLANPSDDDDKFTRAMVTSLAINDCHLMDHIIIGEKSFYSYRQEGVIDKYREDMAGMFMTKYVSQPEAKYEVNYDKK